MQVEVGGPLNALSSNKDNSMLVVGGRTILKIFSVEETCFKEKTNLRSGRRHGLNLSCADVAWNHINENIIATAATNGTIIAWDLNTSNRNKQFGIFNEHKRTVQKVCFHNCEPGRLLSGSQDGTMRMFDMRKKECVATFNSKSDGVRCVQFCPHDYFQFAASFDNGSVQVWDYRNTCNPLLQFIAHKGSVYTLEWHPDPKEKQRLATGGRDRLIKIWDMIDQKMHEKVVIPAQNSVAVTHWRSQRKEQIATSAIIVDHSINIWDIRRTFMPFAQFNVHTDVASGIVWKKNDPDIIFSCSKAGSLCQHTMKDAYRLSEHCNLSGLALSSRGFIGYAGMESTGSYDAQPHIKTKTPARFGFRSVVGVGVNAAISQQKNDTGGYTSTASNALNSKLHRFLNSKSCLCVYTEKKGDLDLSMQSFIGAAKMYQLDGLPFDELCAHNADIASRLSLSFDSYIWKYLRLFFGKKSMPNMDQSKGSTFHSGSLEKGGKSGRDSIGQIKNLKNGIGTGESNGEDSEQHSDPETEHYLTDIAKGHATSEQECYYSEEDMQSDPEFGSRGMHGGFSSGPECFVEHNDWMHIKSASRDTTLPAEAFQQRLVLQTADGIDGQMACMASGDEDTVVNSSPITIPASSVAHYGHDKYRRKRNAGTPVASHSQSSSPSDSLSISPVVHIKSFEAPFIDIEQKLNLVASMFLSMIDHGQSIQVITCSIVVLNHFFPSLRIPIDEQVLEYWQSSYLDVISRYELWNHYAQIINLSRIPAINNMNSSCTIHTSCGGCKKRMPQSSPWICTKHSDNEHKVLGLESGLKCDLCQMVAKSLYVWCQGCCHGGHMNCMKQWFKYPKSEGQCPTGCGHVCLLPL